MSKNTRENMTTKTYIIHNPCMYFKDHEDHFTTYKFKFSHEGIINSEDIDITIDYELPIDNEISHDKLFSRIEIFYDKICMARSTCQEYINHNKSLINFKVSDLFPKYSFTCKNDNQHFLEFVFDRGFDTAIMKDLHIEYKCDTTINPVLFKNDFPNFEQSILRAEHNIMIYETKYESIKDKMTIVCVKDARKSFKTFELDIDNIEEYYHNDEKCIDLPSSYEECFKPGRNVIKFKDMPSNVWVIISSIYYK